MFLMFNYYITIYTIFNRWWLLRFACLWNYLLLKHYQNLICIKVNLILVICISHDPSTQITPSTLSSPITLKCYIFPNGCLRSNNQYLFCIGHYSYWLWINTAEFTDLLCHISRLNSITPELQADFH